MSNPNTFTARGGVTGADSEYGAGVPYYDTLSGMALAWKKANPDDRRSVNQIALEIATINHIRTINGVACDDVTKIKDARIHRGETYTLPAGNPINPELHYDCPPERKPQPQRPVEPVDVETPPEPIVPEVEQTIIPRAQALFTPEGARRYTVAINRYDFFNGEPPRDPAAMGRGRNDRRVGARLVPGDSEGTRFAGTGPRSALGAVTDVMGVTPAQVTSRAGEDSGRFGELTYKPSQVEFVGADGLPAGPNRRFPYKFEQEPRFAMNADGQLISLTDGSALISDERRKNPFKGNRWRDDETARNVINTFNRTPEGLDAVLTYQGIDRALGIREARFFAEGGTPTTKDAEEMLELQVSLGLHPLVWSVDSRGAPIGNYDTIRGQVDAIFNSVQFASLPQADQDRLRSTYQPLMAEIDNPRELEAKINAAGGRAGWLNPMDEWAQDRSQLGFIRDGYSDRPGPKPQPPQSGDWRADRDWRRARAADRVARTEEVGGIYSNYAWNQTLGAPSQTEVEVGMGVRFNTERQSAPAMASARVEFLKRLETDPEFRAQYIEQVLKTPGASQSAFEPLFVASRGTGRDSQILGFGSDREADGFVRDTAEGLGGRQYRDRIEYRGLNPAERVVFGGIYTLTGGAVRLGTNRNQTRGIADGFPEAVTARWDAGGQTREQVDAAFLGLIRQARIAEESGNPIAGSSLVNAVDPNRNEQANGNRFSPSYQGFLDRADQLGVKDVIYDQMIVNDPGLRGDVERGTEGRVLAGEQTVTLTPEEAAALARGEKVTRRVPAPATAAGTDGISLTTGSLAQFSIENGEIVMKPLNAEGSLSGITTRLPTDTITIGENGELTIATPALTDTSTINLNLQDDAMSRALTSARGITLSPDITTTAPVPTRVFGSALNVAPAQDARAAIVAGDPNAGAMAAAVVSTANNPDRISQGDVNQSLLSGTAGNPVMFSLITAELLAGGQGNTQSYVDALDRGGRENSRYADLLDHHAAAIRAAGDNAEARFNAEMDAMKAFSSFFAEGDKASQRLNALSLLSNHMSQDADTNARFAGEYGRIAVNDSGAYLKSLVDKGILSQDDVLSLSTVLATENPALRAQRFDSWVETFRAGQSSNMAGFGFSWVEILKLAVLTYNPPGNPPEKPPVITLPNCPGVPGSSGQETCVPGM